MQASAHNPALRPASPSSQGMQAVTLGLTNINNLGGMSGFPSGNHAQYNNTPVVDPSQLEQLVQLLGGVGNTAGAANLPPKQTAVVECPKSMVGRVIGKGGETIKSLQQYTGAMIQIDQSTDPTRVTIAGSPQSLQLAVSMVQDIVRGTFKGFAMLRQIAVATGPQGVLGPYGQPQPVYVHGYGFVPPSQALNPDDPMAAPMMQLPPSGPLTPPITPLRANAANNLAGAFPPDTLAALLGSHQLQQQQTMSPPPGPTAQPAPQQQDALIRHLLSQLAMQQTSSPPVSSMHSPTMDNTSAGLDQGSIQTMLSHAGLMGAHQAAANATPGVAQMLPHTSASNLPASTSLMLSAQGTPALIGSAGGSAYGTMSPPHGNNRAGSMSPSAIRNGSSGLEGSFSPPAPRSNDSGRASPLGASMNLSAAAHPSLSRPNASGESSPMGLFGAIGARSSSGHVGVSVEDALSARMGALFPHSDAPPAASQGYGGTSPSWGSP